MLRDCTILMVIGSRDFDVEGELPSLSHSLNWRKQPIVFYSRPFSSLSFRPFCRFSSKLFLNSLGLIYPFSAISYDCHAVCQDSLVIYTDCSLLLVLIGFCFLFELFLPGLDESNLLPSGFPFFSLYQHSTRSMWGSRLAKPLFHLGVLWAFALWNSTWQGIWIADKCSWKVTIHKSRDTSNVNLAFLLEPSRPFSSPESHQLPIFAHPISDIINQCFCHSLAFDFTIRW